MSKYDDLEDKIEKIEKERDFIYYYIKEFPNKNFAEACDAYEQFLDEKDEVSRQYKIVNDEIIWNKEYVEKFKNKYSYLSQWIIGIK